MAERGTARGLNLRPVGLAAEFYERCGTGTLHFQRCLACETWRHLPRAMCAECGSTEWEWAPSTGRGTIYTWTVTHQTAHPAFAGETPYAAIVVEMEEGVRMASRLLGCDPSEIELGMGVEVEMVAVSDDAVTLPMFRPAAG